MRAFLHAICCGRKPVMVKVGGADHFGDDAWLRCPACQLRTTNHVECEPSTMDEALRVLRKEWNAGRLTDRSIHDDLR